MATGFLDYTRWVFPPLSLTFVVHVEVILLCHQLAVVLSVILKLQHLHEQEDGHGLYPRSQDPKSSHDPLLAGQPAISSSC